MSWKRILKEETPCCKIARDELMEVFQDKLNNVSRMRQIFERDDEEDDDDDFDDYLDSLPPWIDYSPEIFRDTNIGKKVGKPNWVKGIGVIHLDKIINKIETKIMPAIKNFECEKLKRLMSAAPTLDFLQGSGNLKRLKLIKEILEKWDKCERKRNREREWRER